ncbi:MAG: LysR family transcriptional regulator [Eubacteriales bacterium]|nr:LysR family transcriptional regulator [Eubacteriales bacterium]
MDIKYLNYILAIASRRNMTKAAEDLFVSQSSLSQYVSRLEAELGTPLFIRNKNELTLTPAGVLYTEAAQKVVKIQKELYQNIASLNERGRITVGVTSNFGLRMLSEIIPHYQQRYPGVSIEISEVSLPGLKKLLVDGNVNIGLAAEISTVPFGGMAQILRQEEVFFAIPKNHPYAHSHASGTRITVEELIHWFSADNFVLSKHGSSLRMLTDQFFESCDFNPNAFCETNSISATRSMVAQGTGVAFVGESCSVDRESIAYYALSPALYRLNMVVRQKDWIQNEPEQAFMEYILDYFKKNTEQPWLAENYVISPPA